jgi:hypothetical protein
MGSLLGPDQHRRTEVDSDDTAIGWVEWKISTSADTGIQDQTGQTLEEQWTDGTIAAVFERKIKPIVSRCDALISLKVVRHSPLACKSRAFAR